MFSLFLSGCQHIWDANTLWWCICNFNFA